MKITDFLQVMEQELYNIHATLFGGSYTSEELEEIKSTLIEYKKILEDFKYYNEEIGNTMNRIIKLFTISFYTIALLIFYFVILNILSLLVGCVLFTICIYLSHKFKKGYQQLKENDDISSKITSLLSNITYKEEITKKKLERLKKEAKLQEQNILPLLEPSLEKEKEFTRVRKRK